MDTENTFAPTSFIEQLARMTDPTHMHHSIQHKHTHKRLVPPHVESLEAYKPGRPTEDLKKDLGIDRFVNLASNENSMGTPAGILDAIQTSFPDLARYPDPAGVKLRTALANLYNVKFENVAIGSGAEGIMANIVRAFLHGDDEVITAEGTFIGFYVMMKAQGVHLKLAPLKDYRFDLDAIADMVTEKTKLIYLCNPNNPTGAIITRQEFDVFIKKIPEHVLIILDEAYYEFVGNVPEFPDSMSYRRDNVLTLRTFSKAYAMAGLRLGYGLGHDYLIDFVNRIKLPFEPNTLAQAAGLAALADKEFLPMTQENVRIGKKMIVDEFTRLGLHQVPSYGNFVMVDFGSEERVNQLHRELLSKGVAIRPLKPFKLPHCFRVTIGMPDENEIFIKALRSCL